MTVNYPYKRKQAPASNQKTVDFGKRGMSFEDDLERSNAFYLAADRAVIHKKPTPMQIVKVDYPARSAAKITEAYFIKPSTTDFNGVYKGRYIDFEAKETSNKSSFPLDNLHEHQVRHMEKSSQHGGIVFLLVKFSQLNEIYLLPNEKLKIFWLEYKEGNRRSIKKNEFATHGILILEGAYPRVDYLNAIDGLLEKT
ncbi:MAG: Holliday junction resolvase RecU [Turicibacter sp.]|nr:Holliday junction resolvase RecU [Turicibacter sp.]